MSATIALSPRVSSPPRRHAIGVLFLAFFGTLWLMLGCRGLFDAGWMLLLPALVGGAILLAGWRLARHENAAPAGEESTAERRRTRRFQHINMAQWGAIIALIALLNVVGHPEWISPMIMFVVGIHFIPLAFLFDNKAHLITGPALALLALLYPFVAPGGPTSPWGPLAAGLILLTSACHLLTKAHRQQSA